MQVKKPILKSNIIETARESFFKYGYKNTTVDRIAKEAYTTVGNLYNYFDGKKEIFDEVIGDIPFQIDTYISTYYYQAVRNIGAVQLNMDLENAFPETLIFSKKVSMTLWILFEGAEGTQYAQYKEGLYGIIEDCTRKAIPDINPMLAKIFRESFLNKILSITKTVEKKNNKLERQKDKFYSFYIDRSQKIFQISTMNWPIEIIKQHLTKENIEGYLENYEKIVQTINAHEYELILDFRQIPNMAEYEILSSVFTYYHRSNFFKLKFLLRPSQIALSVALKRLFLSVGCTVEICMMPED